MNEFEVLCKMKQISRVSHLDLKINLVKAEAAQDKYKWDIIATIPSHSLDLTLYQRLINCPLYYTYVPIDEDIKKLLYPCYTRYTSYQRAEELEIFINLLDKDILDCWVDILSSSRDIYYSKEFINNFRAIVDFFLVKVFNKWLKMVPEKKISSIHDNRISLFDSGLLAYCVMSEREIKMVIYNDLNEEEEVKF